MGFHPHLLDDLVARYGALRNLADHPDHHGVANNLAPVRIRVGWIVSAPALAQYYSEKDDDGRAYKHPLTGEKLPSVTTILKMADKSGLAQWAADQAISWAVLNWHLLGARSNEDAFKAGRWRWKDVRDERAQVGTGIHETIEAIHTGSWEYPELDEEQQRIMLQWYMLNEEYDIEPILSEFTVWNPGVTAGTADGLWKITDKRTGESWTVLVDIKTSKNHWPEHDYQLAALAKAPILMVQAEDGWVEAPMPYFDRVAIVHLREDRHEIIWVDNIDENFDVFMGYVQVWRGKQRLKELAKEVGF